MTFEEMQKKIMEEIEEARRRKDAEAKIVEEILKKSSPNQPVRSTLTIRS